VRQPYPIIPTAVVAILAAMNAVTFLKTEKERRELDYHKFFTMGFLEISRHNVMDILNNH